ncbi:MAG: beta-galactosidase [Bacteroidetes bacterium]|nr:beta-galactosidase [Bacteroidota bacterium]
MRIMYSNYLLFGIFFLIQCNVQAREIRNINQDWEFVRMDMDFKKESDFVKWEKVNIPHTWNNKDAQSGGDVYRGTGWYRKSFFAEKTIRNKKLYLRFEGVGQVADVYVNGHLAGTHEGGYSAFCFDITPLVQFGAKNQIYVKVNNELKPDIIPVNHRLFMVYGGIYRSVSLFVTNKVHISTTDFASPGVYITQDIVSQEKAEISLKIKLENSHILKQKVLIKTLVLDSDGHEVVFSIDSCALPPVRQTDFIQHLVIKDPVLWNGKKNPYLYKVKVQLIMEREVADEVSQSLGLRYYHFDSNHGFMLNGKPYRLYGVCRHQEWENYGSAMSDRQHKTDFDLINEMGATTVRLAHYQQSDYVYSYCDTLGLIVWAEVPFVNTWSGQEAKNAKQQYYELILQNFNHPSIIIWGIHNEVYARNISEYPVQLTREMHTIARQLDPSRYTVSVSGWGNLDRPMNFHTDLQGINRYFGWYEGKIEDMAEWMDSTRVSRPDNLICVAEYGCGANVEHQAEVIEKQPDPTGGQFFPESYQTRMHEVQWSQIQKRSFIWGSYVWNMFDFCVPGWDRGGRKGLNHKGLVSYDRKIKKDGFFWYKANWSDQPVLYISEKRLKERSLKKTSFKIYSNIGEPQFYLNGKRIKHEKGLNEVMFIANDVKLKKGENKLKVIVVKNGIEFTDEAVFIKK